MPTNENYYQLLGIKENATREQIRQAYRTQRLRMHPDKVRQSGGSEAAIRNATASFIKLQEAYDTLLDPQKRREYSRSRKDEYEQLMTPQGLERPSAYWHQYTELLKEQYRERPSQKINSAERQKKLDAFIPLRNQHFSSLSYQNLYVLTIKNSNGIDVDESFSDVYAVIAEKMARFGDTEVSCDFLAESLTPKIAYAILLQFLKGSYFGPTLIRIQDYLQRGLVTEKNTISSKLYGAVHQLMSLSDLKRDYRQALQAIHDLYDVANSQYKSVEDTCGIIARQKTLLDVEHQESLVKANAAKKDLEKATQDFINIETLREQSSRISSMRDYVKQNFTGEQREIELESLDNQRYQCEQRLIGADEKIVHLDLQKSQAEEQYQALKKDSDVLKQRLDDLEVHKLKIQANKTSPAFLDVIDSHYFKLTLATSVSHYWNDPTPVVAPEALVQITAGMVSSASKEDIKKYPAIRQVLHYADKKLVAMVLANNAPQDYCELADFFYDLARSGVARLDAYIAAGLCWQLAARQSESEPDQMYFESRALTTYQVAIRLAIQMPPSYALYVTIHVSKYLSEFQFDTTTLSYDDRQQLVKHLQSRYDKIPATHYAMFSVHNGSILDSMQGAMDRALYLMTCFPSYSAHTYLLDQVSRQRCYVDLMKGLIQRFAEQFDAPDSTIELNVRLAEQFYYRYEHELLSKDRSETKLNDLRLQSMHLLLEQSRTSLHEMNQLMNVPYISMPLKDGWWIPGPLNYPQDPERLGLVVYKSFDGYVQNTKTGEIQLLLTRWYPGDNPEDQLFTHDDLLDLVKGGIGGATFSLDPNSAYRTFDPLQVVRCSPPAVKSAKTLLQALWYTDYAMKMASQGMEINMNPPFNTRKIQLFDGLDESAREEVLGCAQSDEQGSESQATRFWIKMETIPRLETKKGYQNFISFGKPEVVVKKQLLTLGPNGELEDAPIDMDDTSRHAQFAKAFTKHYKAIREQLPAFRQLEELYKIMGAVNELQEQRLLNDITLVFHKSQLDSPTHWEAKASQKRKEWTDNLNSPEYWERCAAERKAHYTDLLEDESHWAQLIEELYDELKNKKEALDSQQGEEYQRLREQFVERYQTQLHRVYAEEPKLTWTLEHPDFKAHYAKIKEAPDSSMSALLGSLFKTIMPELSLDSLVGTNALSEEEEFAQIKTSLKNKFLRYLDMLKHATGIVPHQAARTQWMQGDILPMVQALAQYELARQCEQSEFTPEINDCYTLLQQEIQLAKTEELRKKREEDVPELIFNKGEFIIKIKKNSYTLGDPEFNTYYNNSRAAARQQTINSNKATIANWNQFESQYLAQIDDLFNREFTPQSKLTSFNDSVAKAWKSKTEEWTLEFFVTFDTKEEAQAIAEAFLQGNIEQVVSAHTEQAMREIKDALKNNKRLECIELQNACDRLLAIESAAQQIVLEQELTRIKNLPEKEQIFPNYDYLIPYFAESAYTEAVHDFMRGDFSRLIEGRVKQDLDDLHQELSGDLYSQANDLIVTQKIDLQNNLVAKVEKYVDELKQVLTNNMEGQVAAYIQQCKTSLQEAIADEKRCESGFMHLKLGKPQTQESDSSLRVPALFLHRKNSYVYGGVCAQPTYQRNLDQLDYASYSLRTAADFNRCSQIDSARRTAQDVSLQVSSRDFFREMTVQFAIRRLEEDIRFAQMQESFNRPIWSVNPTMHFQNNLNVMTCLDLPGLEVTSPNTQALQAWRYVGQAFNSVTNSLDAAVQFSASVFRGATDYVANTYSNVTNNRVLLNAAIVAMTHMPLQQRDPDIAAMQNMVITNPILYNTALSNMRLSVDNVTHSRDAEYSFNTLNLPSGINHATMQRAINSLNNNHFDPNLPIVPVLLNQAEENRKKEEERRRLEADRQRQEELRRQQQMEAERQRQEIERQRQAEEARQRELARRNDSISSAVAEYFNAAVHGVVVRGVGNVLDMAGSVVRTAADAAIIHAAKASNPALSQLENAESQRSMNALPMVQNAQTRMHERVDAFSDVLGATASFARDAAILHLASGQSDPYASFGEYDAYRNYMQELPIVRKAMHNMDERVSMVTQLTQSFMNLSGPERVEAIAEFGTTMYLPGKVFELTKNSINLYREFGIYRNSPIFHDTQPGSNGYINAMTSGKVLIGSKPPQLKTLNVEEVRALRTAPPVPDDGRQWLLYTIRAEDKQLSIAREWDELGFRWNHSDLAGIEFSHLPGAPIIGGGRMKVVKDGIEVNNFSGHYLPISIHVPLMGDHLPHVTKTAFKRAGYTDEEVSQIKYFEHKNTLGKTNGGRQPIITYNPLLSSQTGYIAGTLQAINSPSSPEAQDLEMPATRELIDGVVDVVQEYSVAALRGFGRGFLNTINMFAHPIDSVVAPVVRLYSDIDTLENARFYSPEMVQATQMRAQERADRVRAMVNYVSTARGPQRVELGATMLTSMILPGTVLNLTTRQLGLFRNSAARSSTVTEIDPPAFPPGTVGAAKRWTVSARLSYYKLPKRGKAHFIPPEGYDANMPLPKGRNGGYIDRFGNEWRKGPSRTIGDDFEWDVQLSKTGKNYFATIEQAFDRKIIKSDSYVNISPRGEITH